ncbi:MAG: DUF6485 family protein [Candidatus Cloacimonetes bacterium]|nr:DUF6485 family protein [Candidatus Cloacimonadota bacterium]
MICKNKNTNQENCNCTYPCSRKGMCCECIRYHRSMEELPACYFPDDYEKAYDRSIANYIELKQQGKI